MLRTALRNYVRIDLCDDVIRVHDLHGTLNRTFAADAYPTQRDWIADAEDYATEAVHRLRCPYVCNY